MRLSLALCVAYLAVLAAPSGAGAAAAEGFPDGFLWGTATAGFQVEAGGSPPFADRASDWWAFTHDAALIREGAVSGDRVERGAGSWRRYREDLDLASRGLRNNAIRLGIEWSRIFPRSTAGVRTGTSVSTAELRRLDRLANRTRRAPLPQGPAWRAQPRAAADAHAQPLHAAAVDPRHAGRARRVRRSRPRRARARRAAPRGLARRRHRRRVPQVRGVRRVEVRRPGRPVGDAQRADRPGLAGLREHPGDHGLQGAGRCSTTARRSRSCATWGWATPPPTTRSAPATAARAWASSRTCWTGARRTRPARRTCAVPATLTRSSTACSSTRRSAASTTTTPTASSTPASASGGCATRLTGWA